MAYDSSITVGKLSDLTVGNLCEVKTDYAHFLCVIVKIKRSPLKRYCFYCLMSFDQSYEFGTHDNFDHNSGYHRSCKILSN